MSEYYLCVKCGFLSFDEPLRHFLDEPSQSICPSCANQPWKQPPGEMRPDLIELREAAAEMPLAGAHLDTTTIPGLRLVRASSQHVDDQWPDLTGVPAFTVQVATPRERYRYRDNGPIGYAGPDCYTIKPIDKAAREAHLQSLATFDPGELTEEQRDQLRADIREQLDEQRARILTTGIYCGTLAPPADEPEGDPS